MKKLVVLVLTAGTFFTASAQVQIGLKAGANFATLSGSAADGAQTKVDFHGGAFAQIALFNSFSLQPELMYSGQGAKGNQNETEFTLNQAYVNLPVLFKYQHSSGLFAETGPQLGLLVAANVKANPTSLLTLAGLSVSVIRYRCFTPVLMPVIISVSQISWLKMSQVNRLPTVYSRLACFIC